MFVRETLRVAACELRLMVAARTEVLLLLAFALLLGISAWNGHRWMREQQRSQQAVRTSETTELCRLKEEIIALESGKSTAASPWLDPRRAAAFAARWERAATLPPAPAAILSIGQGELYSSIVGVTAIRRDAALDQEVLENPYSLLMGRLDMSFVLIHLLPLLVIALCGGLLARERESGALGLALSQPLSLSSFAFGKGLSRWAVLASLAAAASGAALLMSASQQGAALSFMRVGLSVLALALYIGFWVTLSIWLGATSRSAASQMMSLIGIWVLLLFVIPVAVSQIARTSYPTPSRLDFIAATRSAALPVRSGGTKLLSRYYEDHPELAKGNPDRTDFYKKYYLVEQRVEAAVAPLHQRHESALSAQQRTVSWLAAASPALLLQSILDDLAGTGLARYQRFASQVDRHQAAWREFIVSRLFTDRAIRAADLDSLTTFEFTDESSEAMSLRVIPSLCGLLFFVVMLALLSAQRLRRPGIIFG